MFERRHSHVVIVEDDMLFSPGGYGCWLAGAAGVALTGCRLPLSACGQPRLAMHGANWVLSALTAGLGLLVQQMGLQKRQPAHTRFHADFLLYFEATAPLLDSDPTLWCGTLGRTGALLAEQDLPAKVLKPLLPTATPPRPLARRAVTATRCISSWNDNGFVTNHEWDVRRMFRTSYFPGGAGLMG